MSYIPPPPPPPDWNPDWPRYVSPLEPFHARKDNKKISASKLINKIQLYPKLRYYPEKLPHIAIAECISEMNGINKRIQEGRLPEHEVANLITEIGVHARQIMHILETNTLEVERCIPDVRHPVTRQKRTFRQMTGDLIRIIEEGQFNNYRPVWNTYQKVLYNHMDMMHAHARFDWYLPHKDLDMARHSGSGSNQSSPRRSRSASPSRSVSAVSSSAGISQEDQERYEEQKRRSRSSRLYSTKPSKYRIRPPSPLTINEDLECRNRRSYSNVPEAARVGYLPESPTGSGARAKTTYQYYPDQGSILPVERRSFYSRLQDLEQRMADQMRIMAPPPRQPTRAAPQLRGRPLLGRGPAQSSPQPSRQGSQVMVGPPPPQRQGSQVMVGPPGQGGQYVRIHDPMRPGHTMTVLRRGPAPPSPLTMPSIPPPIEMPPSRPVSQSPSRSVSQSNSANQLEPPPLMRRRGGRSISPRPGGMYFDNPPSLDELERQQNQRPQTPP